jgi:hypothetical protein
MAEGVLTGGHVTIQSWRRLGVMILVLAARVASRSGAVVWSVVLLRRVLLALSWLIPAGEPRGELRRLSDAALGELFEDLGDLPAAHLSLQVELPKLHSPALARLFDAVANDDPDAELLEVVLGAIDTPVERARLARAAIIQAEARTIDEKLANAALVDLGSDSRRLLRAGLLQAVAVRVGATRTPAGVLLAA